jgi:hypothetical protein
MKKIFIAMAETEAGDRVFGNAYLTYQKAYAASLEMIKEVQDNMEWQLSPIVDEIDLIED